MSLLKTALQGEGALPYTADFFPRLRSAHHFEVNDSVVRAVCSSLVGDLRAQLGLMRFARLPFPRIFIEWSFTVQGYSLGWLNGPTPKGMFRPSRLGALLERHDAMGSAMPAQIKDKDAFLGSIVDEMPPNSGHRGAFISPIAVVVSPTEVVKPAVPITGADRDS